MCSAISRRRLNLCRCAVIAARGEIHAILVSTTPSLRLAFCPASCRCRSIGIWGIRGWNSGVSGRVPQYWGGAAISTASDREVNGRRSLNVDLRADDWIRPPGSMSPTCDQNHLIRIVWLQLNLGHTVSGLECGSSIA